MSIPINHDSGSSDANIFLYFPEVKQQSDWTGWIKTNVTKEGYIERRYQSVCLATVESDSEIRTRLRTKHRFCPIGGGSNCTSSTERAGKPSANGAPSFLSPYHDDVMAFYCRDAMTQHSAPVDQSRDNDRQPSDDVTTTLEPESSGDAEDDNFMTTSEPLDAHSGSSFETYPSCPQSTCAPCGTAPPPEPTLDPSMRKLLLSCMKVKRQFGGYCNCRDMGAFKICYPCKTPAG